MWNPKHSMEWKEGREGIKKLVKYIRKIVTKETTSERRKDTILNMEKIESRTRYPIKKRTEG
jgi:hypothetical protein